MKQSVKMIVGNWKMNGLGADLATTVADLLEGLRQEPQPCRIGLCPPATLIDRLAREVRTSAIEVGGQDCRVQERGAFTGGVSAEMLADAGAALVILGHSERRQEFGESDALVSDKVGAALRAGLTPIICVGETLAQREAGQAASVVRGQILGSLHDDLADKDWALAYEPVWAIGTGLTPTLDQIAEIHAAARDAMTERLGDGGRTAPILYGGSVNPQNARDILGVDEVGGALVGGASLKAADFLDIIRAAAPASVAAGGQG
jgi:triosephosphate isomerase (TIM)